MTMAAIYEPLLADRRGTFDHTFLGFVDAAGVPADFTGYSGFGQIREGPDGDLLASVTVTITALPAAVRIQLSAAQTTLLDQHGLHYDVAIVPPAGEPEYIRYGPFTVRQSIGRTS